MILRDREVAFATLQTALDNNMENIATNDRSQLSIVTGFGFLGIGKSSIGKKAKELTWNGRTVHHASIDFLYKDPNMDLATYVGLRLFYALFFRGCNANYHLATRDSTLLGNLRFSNVLKAYAHTCNTSGSLTSFPLIALLIFDHSPHSHSYSHPHPHINFHPRPSSFIFITLSLPELVPLTLIYRRNSSNGSAFWRDL